MTANLIERLRGLLAGATLPVLAVEPDMRPGMSWNDHIVHDADPDMRVAFMANAGPATHARSALIVEAVNNLPALLDALAAAEKRVAHLTARLVSMAYDLAILKQGLEEIAQHHDLACRKGLDASWATAKAKALLSTPPSASPSSGERGVPAVPATNDAPSPSGGGEGRRSGDGL